MASRPLRVGVRAAGREKDVMVIIDDMGVRRIVGVRIVGKAGVFLSKRKLGVEVRSDLDI